MFGRSKSKTPIGVVSEVLDAVLPKKQKTSRKKKVVGVGLVSAAVATVFAAISKDKDPK